MTVIPFPTPAAPQPRNPGNGALEAVRDYLDRVHPSRGHGATDCGEYLDGTGTLPDGDHMLAWLAAEGFVVVPMVRVAE